MNGAPDSVACLACALDVGPDNVVNLGEPREGGFCPSERWGYNYITNSNPASGACYYNSEARGACANTTADSATVDKPSGDSSDYVWNTFRNAGGDRFNEFIADTISAVFGDRQ